MPKRDIIIKDNEFGFVKSLSSNQRSKLRNQIINSVLAIIRDKELDIEKENGFKQKRKSRYIGDIIDRGGYKLKTSKDGEEYYVFCE